MAKDDYEAGLLGETAGHDTFSPDYQAGQNDRGSGGGGGDAIGGIAGGGGIVFVAVMVILAFFAFILAICTYPIAGVITGIAFAIGIELTNGDGANTMNGVGLVFAWMVPCYVVYRLAMLLEGVVQQFKWYRIFRTFWRIAAYTFMAYTFGSALHRYDAVKHTADYVLHGAIVFFTFFISYLNSIRLDEKYDLDPVRLKWLDTAMKPILSRIPGVRNSTLVKWVPRRVYRPKTMAEALKTTPYEPVAAPEPPTVN